ncbi:hypothetical protein, partial [Acidithiobacillus caldus]|uniref:hypothetical protein n=1 Tax=Acidithiobacillus caldus TaxID=33059 RepID=UPI001C06BB03
PSGSSEDSLPRRLPAAGPIGGRHPFHLLQSAKAKARGYRTHKNFINMAYLILGKLDLRLPT